MLRAEGNRERWERKNKGPIEAYIGFLAKASLLSVTGITVLYISYHSFL